MPAAKNKQLRQVLVSRFSAIGDVAMTIPALYTVCRANPGVRFVMLTRPAMAAMMVCRPDNLTVHAVDPSRDYRGLGGLWRLVGELIAAYGPFDAMADLHNVIRTRAIGAMLGLRGVKVARLDKDRRGRRALTRHRGKALQPLVPQHERYRRVFAQLGLEAPEARFRSIFPADGKADPAVFASVTPPKAPGERWIAVAPFARHKGKIYPPGLMAQAVDGLAAMPGARIFLFGGGDDERRILASWTRPNVISLADERHGFALELALLSHMDAVVSMDSANMHLASLVAVPVVSVWGATHPYCGFRGFGQTDDNAVQLTMTCRPCSIFGDKPCRFGDYRCLAGITPATIVAKVKNIIENG